MSGGCPLWPDEAESGIARLGLGCRVRARPSLPSLLGSTNMVAPQATMLLGADGWASIKQHGVTYELDVTKAQP